MDLALLFVGEYFGKQGQITKVELDNLPRDTEFARRYYDDNNRHQIICSIVLSGAPNNAASIVPKPAWSVSADDHRPAEPSDPDDVALRHKLVARQG